MILRFQTRRHWLYPDTSHRPLICHRNLLTKRVAIRDRWRKIWAYLWNKRFVQVRCKRKLSVIYLMTLGVATLFMLISNNSHAACSCICVNGLNRPLCSSVSDLKPLCPPKVCPRVPPITRPLDQSRLPPVGTSICSSKYIYNKYNQRYEWRLFCK